MVGGGVVAGQHRHAQRTRRRESGPVRTLGQTLDAGPQHVDAAHGVQGEVLHAQRPEHSAGPVHRRRDVPHLQVEEHLVAEIAEGTDGVRSGRAEELEADLGHAEVVDQRCGQAVRSHEVVHVQDQCQATADLVAHVHLGPARGPCVNHALLRSAPSP